MNDYDIKISILALFLFLFLFSSSLCHVGVHISKGKPQFIRNKNKNYTSSKGITHQCIHDKLLAKEKQISNGVFTQLKARAYFSPEIEQRIAHEKRTKSKKRSIENTRSTFLPIRINYRTDYLYEANEGPSQRSCFSVGQKFKQGDPVADSPTCQSSSDIDCWGICTTNMVITSEIVTEFETKIVPQIQQTFNQLYSTRPLAGILNIPSYLTSCGADGGVPIPSNFTTIDPNDSDLTIFVTMRPISEGVLGWGIACLTEPEYGRPVLAQVNLNPVIYNNPLNVKLGILSHETTHSLGFSSAFFNSFVDSNGQVMSNSQFFENSQFTAPDGNTYTVSMPYLKTPLLVQKYQEHFGCNTTTAVPLDEYGGPGTAVSHFKKTMFINDLMIPDISWYNPTDNYVFSEFLLATMQDSGWYIANFTLAGKFLWGYKAGCSFVENRCENWNLGHLQGYFCDTAFYSDGSTYVNYCNFDLTSKGYCDIVTYSSPLGYYEHLSNPNQGGPDPYMDYCPIVYDYSNGLCSDTSNNAKAGERYGPNSACFDSNLSLIGEPKNEVDARCFQYRCVSGQLQILINAPFREKVYTCPKDQSYLQITSGLPGGMSGYLSCPQNGYTIICENNPNANSTSNEGGPPGYLLCKWLGLLCSSASRAVQTSLTTHIGVFTLLLLFII
jgi:leishmanolysin